MEAQRRRGKMRRAIRVICIWLLVLRRVEPLNGYWSHLIPKQAKYLIDFIQTERFLALLQFPQEAEADACLLCQLGLGEA